MPEEQQEAFPGADAFVQMWTQFASKMMAAGMAPMPDGSPFDAARQFRSAMFKAWGDYLDEYMRSEAFLETMRQTLDGASQARKQLNDFLGRVQHEMQGASRQDVDQLMAAMQHVERRIVNQSERIAERLEDLALRVERLESKGAGRDGAGEKKRRKKKRPHDDEPQ